MEHASDLREKGSVAWFSEIKGYGIINRLEKGETVFVHSSDIEEGFITSLRPGELVEFTVIENDKGRLQAIDVKILYNVEN